MKGRSIESAAAQVANDRRHQGRISDWFGGAEGHGWCLRTRRRSEATSRRRDVS